ncbi:MAG: hypothetical protein ACRDTE_19840 [Pseudonocardiaceae bacterium]
MLRRHLLAQGGVAITGAMVTKLGELLTELPGPPPARYARRPFGVRVVPAELLGRLRPH